MNILAVIRREERQIEKKLSKLQHRLNGISAAAEALGRSTNRDVTQDDEACAVSGGKGANRGGCQKTVGES
jgi:hypothetical protein